MKIADMKISDYKVGRVIEEVDGKKWIIQKVIHKDNRQVVVSVGRGHTLQIFFRTEKEDE